MHILILSLLLAALACAAFLGLVSPFKFIEPVTKINGNSPGVTCTIELAPGQRINILQIEGTITKAAGGSGVTSVPAPADLFTTLTLFSGGNAQRARTSAELWGATGLNALCDENAGGTVVYSQAGNGNLSTEPVLIGSAADTAQIALLSTNTATKAVFNLPILFCEPYRKEYDMTEALGLVQAYDNGDGTFTSAGVTTIELAMCAAGTFTTQNIACLVEYDDLKAPKGKPILLMKEYRHVKQYSAAGEIEVGDQLPLKDALCRVSLLTTADKISKVVVKQGARTIRNFTRAQAKSGLIARDYNPAAMPSNRFDIEFDLNDNPEDAPMMDSTKPITMTATLETANDSPKNIRILSSYWGPKD